LLTLISFQEPKLNNTLEVLHVFAHQDTRREAKETTRYNALLCQKQSLVSTPTALVKEKQSAVLNDGLIAIEVIIRF
jgi:hypothetical protein